MTNSSQQPVSCIQTKCQHW